MKKVLISQLINPFYQQSPLIVVIILTIFATRLRNVNCGNDATSEYYHYPGSEYLNPSNRHKLEDKMEEQLPFNFNHNYDNYMEAKIPQFYDAHQSTFSRRPISGVDDSLSAYQKEFQVNRRQDADAEHGEGHRENSSGAEHHSTSHEMEHTEEVPDNPEDTKSPYEIALESLTAPDKLLPIINDLTLIALVILHLPAIVPTILIPLAFFCVGALLIPIVRVNYFINHKDDGEDGRSI